MFVPRYGNNQKNRRDGILETLNQRHTRRGHNKSRNFQNMVMSNFKWTRHDCKFENFYTTGGQKTSDCFRIYGFCFRGNFVFEAIGCFYHLCSCQKKRSSLTGQDIQRETKMENYMSWDGTINNKKASLSLKCGIVSSGDCTKTDTSVKQHKRVKFPRQISLAEYQHLKEEKESRKMFDFVLCDIRGPNRLKWLFANFFITKNTSVEKKHVGKLRKQFAEEDGLMSQPQTSLISSFTLQSWTIITLLLFFYSELGLVCTEVYHFLDFPPENCFNNFVHSAVDARRQGDENRKCSEVTEILKMLTNSSYG